MHINKVRIGDEYDRVEDMHEEAKDVMLLAHVGPFVFDQLLNNFLIKNGHFCGVADQLHEADAFVVVDSVEEATSYIFCTHW